MSSALPRPASNDCIILFVIGGITSAEVRQVRETVAKHSVNKQVKDAVIGLCYEKHFQVLIGSTSLLTPLDSVINICNRHL